MTSKMLSLEFPAGEEVVPFLMSFASAFDGNTDMGSALLGVGDSLRQAALIPQEPLGLLACLTAEEEAATFLYYAMLEKGYGVPSLGKLRSHPDKVKLVIFAMIMHDYFFGQIPDELSSVIRIEREGDTLKTSHIFQYNGHMMTQDDPLETIVSLGEGESAHDAAIEKTVSEVIEKITPKGFTPASHIKKMANRRNLCLYGSSDKKQRLASKDDINTFESNCCVIVVLGFLVLNGSGPTPSTVKLVKSIFQELK